LTGHDLAGRSPRCRLENGHRWSPTISGCFNVKGQDVMKTFNPRKDRLSQNLLIKVESRREERCRRVSQTDDHLAAAISVASNKKPLNGILMRLDDKGRLGPPHID
jgi:hypothetical protein